MWLLVTVVEIKEILESVYWRYFTDIYFIVLVDYDARIHGLSKQSNRRNAALA